MEAITLPGYIVSMPPIYQGSDSLIVKATPEHDRENFVAIKIMSGRSSDELQRLKLEYSFVKTLDSEYIAKALACLPYERGYALVYEYVPFPSLKTVLAKVKKIKLTDFLELAISIAEALGYIHQHYIIHKDINPANILCDLQTKKIKIIDFGSAINLPKEQASINLQALEGTLAYISPEQSGRMNRGLDYRSDYYSLGVCFYEMLTGDLPFIAEDALGLVYQHMAVKPKPPHQLDKSIPHVVSEIILKLMSKDAQDRYQNAYGLIFDLKECLKQLRENGEIKPFILGSQDPYSRFQIPEKLYGREEEIASLMETYTSAMQGSVNLMLISGYSGVGKTSLVNEIHKPIVAQKGYFVVGKFEQLKRNLPFLGLAQAFDDWVHQVLTTSDQVLNQYKMSILEALDDKAQLIIDLIPSLELIVGPQPPVPEVIAANRIDRLSYLFHKFLIALTNLNYPIVIFLDDLQWIDVASLNLLQRLIMEGETRYLFFIGTYRNNEVDESHSLMRFLNELDKEKLPYQTLELKPLSLSAVTQILADTLHQTTDAVLNLAELCYEKTEGNPFFLEELLFSLYQADLIDFKSQENRWVWNASKIKKQNISPNVAELVLKKIKNLSQEKQSLLYKAACIGASFDLKLLAALDNQQGEAVQALFTDLQREGFIQAEGDVRFSQVFHFNHDKIQEAAYGLKDEIEQKVTHLTIARLMLKESLNETLDEILFNLLGHYNQGIHLPIELGLDAEEKKKLVLLNLRAIHLAKASGAFAAALDFVKQSLNCLGEDAWLKDHELTFEFYAQGAECACLCSNYSLSHEYTKLSLAQIRNPLERLRINQIQILAFTSQGNVAAAVDVALEALAEHGIGLPKKPQTYHVLFMFLKIKWILFTKNISALAKQKEMSDPLQKALLKVLIGAIGPAFTTNPKVCLLLVFTDILLSIKYGPSQGSAKAYLFLAAIYYNQGNVNEGRQIRALSWQMHEKFHNFSETTEMVQHDRFFIAHLTDPLRNNIADYQTSSKTGLAAGDIHYAITSLAISYGFSIVAGIFLQDLPKQLENSRKLAKKHGTSLAEEIIVMTQQSLYSLMHSSEKPERLQGDYYQEEAKRAEYLETGSISYLAYLYFNKWMLATIFELWPQAMQLSVDFALYQKGADLTYWLSYAQYNKGLTYLNYYLLAPYKKRWTLRLQILAAIKKVRNLAKICSVNYLNKYYLLEAEYASIIKNDPQKAQKFYDLAIEESKKTLFLNEEAEANRAAARHHIRQKNLFIALGYIKKSHSLFSLWGADAVARDIEKRYASLFQLEIGGDKKNSRIETQVTLDISSTTVADNMDLKTVLKSSAALSGGLVLSDLLRQLCKIMLENVGAQKFLLLLEKKGNYLIEAEQESFHEKAIVLQSLPPSEEKLPLSILKFILRSKKAILLNLALSDERYSQDPYIQKNQIKSILCLPLLKQMELWGVLYLENKDTEAAFTKERFDILKLLLAQIIISIDNARLYSNTLALNKAYEQFVPYQFLTILERESILDVALGDHSEKVMSILFLDIRDFTTISEKMNARENFNFINRFLSVMAPIIRKNHGLVDKYIGDAIMAIFPESANHALDCALELLQTLEIFNQEEEKNGHPPVKVGIGINTGQVMVGMLGESNRMNATVISDVVNTASRVESLTKSYNTPIIITQNTLDQLQHPESYKFIKLGGVHLKGKAKEVMIWGVEVS